MPAPTFFLGRFSDDQTPVDYNPDDLTTHAVVIGMTGSGKTGLLISLLEEAARQKLPTVVIDPKGDLTNLLLHFPELKPADFQPWIDEEAARRAGVSVEQLAQSTAETWRQGLASWGLGSEQIQALDQVDYAIYTPGSTAGVPVSLLSSFQAPSLAWDENREILREQIASTVTALLGLVGIEDVDPLRSREHILLSNIIETAWSKGQSLDLAALIDQVQTPPIERLGAFPVEKLFPEKDRLDLAMLLNNFLASPSFETWMEGAPLDAKSFLYNLDGSPRMSVFYLAHLDENERMFFVTLLLAAVESWMRAQKGTGSLRALLGFDEITGYLPPVANPPSRPVLLRLLKQARAFGLGLVLATQNPTDLNYKALSNAGSWFIGRLQTERDKERLLDGLQSLENGIDRAAFDRLASQLKPRVFLLHDVHSSRGPALFGTRWTMNYLAGPLTRAQLPQLNAMYQSEVKDTVKPPPAGAPAAASAAAQGAAPVLSGGTPAVLPVAQPATPVRPPAAKVDVAASAQVPAQAGARPNVALGPAAIEVFFPVSLTLQKALSTNGGAFAGPLEPQGLVYLPALILQAQARYSVVKYHLQEQRTVACLLTRPGRADWSSCMHVPFETGHFATQPAADARFAPLPDEWSTVRNVNALQKDFLDWVYRTGTIEIWANDALRVYSTPDEEQAAYQNRLRQALVAAMQPDLNRVAAQYDTKLEALKRKIEKQQNVVEKRQDEVGGRKAEQTASYLDLASSLFTGRRRSLTTPLSKGRMTKQAQDELEDAQQTLDGLRQAWQSLVNERQAALQQVSAEWQARSAQTAQVQVTPYKKDIYAELTALAWMPYYEVKGRDGLYELRAFE